MDDLKVRITLGDTTLEGTLDELLESGTFKMEYDQAGLNKIVQEAIALQRAEYQKDPQHYHVHTITMDELPHHPCTAKPGAHTFGSEMYGSDISMHGQSAVESMSRFGPIMTPVRVGEFMWEAL